MKVTIEGEPREIAALERALKGGQKPRNFRISSKPEKVNQLQELQFRA